MGRCGVERRRRSGRSHSNFDRRRRDAGCRRQESREDSRSDDATTQHGITVAAAVAGHGCVVVALADAGDDAAAAATGDDGTAAIASRGSRRLHYDARPRQIAPRSRSSPHRDSALTLSPPRLNSTRFDSTRLHSTPRCGERIRKTEDRQRRNAEIP